MYEHTGIKIDKDESAILVHEQLLCDKIKFILLQQIGTRAGTVYLF